MLEPALIVAPALFVNAPVWATIRMPLAVMAAFIDVML